MTDKEKFYLILKSIGKPYDVEAKLIPGRRFKCDAYFPEIKTAIEYEGLVSFKSRHTTLTGYTGDCKKYNLIQMEGYKVLRYTVMNYGEVIDDIDRIYKQYQELK